MALYNGIPVVLSQTIVVSRWLVIPIVTMFFTEKMAFIGINLHFLSTMVYSL